MGNYLQAGFWLPVKTILCSRRYYDARGVSSRREYWCYAFFSASAVICCALVLGILLAKPPAFFMAAAAYYFILPALVLIAAFLVYLGLGGLFLIIRRCHDCGISAWVWRIITLLWPLFFSFSFAVFDLLVAGLGISGFSAAYMISYYLLILILVLTPVVIIGLIPGKLTANQYRVHKGLL